MSDRQDIRIALVYALDWAESLIDAHRHMTDVETLALMAEWKAEKRRFVSLLKKRYGGLPPDRFANATLISIEKIKASIEEAGNG